MRPTIYASAASCRHIIVHPWKHISYLPTFMAISWTSHEKGSFQIRSSVLFWNRCISWRATVPDWYLLGFFTWPACKNSFWRGALPQMGGLSFLHAGSSQLDLEGLASAAIWTNCQVGDDDGDCPTPSKCSAASTRLSISSTLGGASLNGDGGELERGPSSFLCQYYLYCSGS